MGSTNTIAWRELRDTLHSRWLLGFGALFALLTLAISYYGLAGSRTVGFQGLGLVSVSLLNLVLFIVPIAAMAQAVMNLSGDAEGLEVLLTQPLTRTQALAGKYLGMAGAVGGTLLGGLLLGGLAVAAKASAADAGYFLLLVAITAGLVLLFLALGTLVAVLWRDRTRALGAAITLWFGLVILYDLIVFGVTIAGAGMPLRVFLVGALLLNPIDAARVLYLLATGTNGFVGATGAVLGEALGGPAGMALLAGALAAWTTAALAAARFVFLRRDF